MSFSKLTIMNMACGELPTMRIALPTERSVAAEECSFWWDIVVGELLEQIRPDFGITRVALALEATNPRPNEWGYAYAVPANLACPLGIKLPQDNAASYTLLAGQTLAGVTNPYGPDLPPLPYEIADELIYTDQEDAVLEFIRQDVNVSLFTPYFAKAVALHLAVRICLPVLKSEKRRAQLETSAEVWTQRAIASAANRSPQSYDFVPENVMVRGG
jgi:hypothetical protein